MVAEDRFHEAHRTTTLKAAAPKLLAALRAVNLEAHTEAVNYPRTITECRQAWERIRHVCEVALKDTEDL